MEFETRGRSEERAHFLRPLNRRYREPIRINREIWFRRECKAFFAGQRKRGEEILVQIGNLYPDSHPASRVRRIMKRGLERNWGGRKIEGGKPEQLKRRA